LKEKEKEKEPGVAAGSEEIHEDAVVGGAGEAAAERLAGREAEEEDERRGEDREEDVESAHQQPGKHQQLHLGTD
jgi:hypothetical protein